MADYPSIGYSREKSQFNPLSGNRLDRADDGTPRIRSFFTADQYELTIHHPAISSTDKGTIESFYSLNKAAFVTFTRQTDSQQFSVLMLNPPEVRHVSGDLWDVTVKMTGAAI